MSLTLEDITLTYADGEGRLTALDGVGLDVPAGTLTAVVGPSGSGKSSLLAVAATLVTPDRGRVVVGGTETGALSAAERAELRRRRMGIVFQQPNLLASLTALEQVELMARIDGRGRGRGRGRSGEVRERARELLDTVGLAGLAHRRPHQLSGGQRQRVGIARALMNEPAVLLVDEPTSALDHERGAAVLELLGRLTREWGTATVLVTHDRERLSFADRVVELVDGRVGVASVS
ncbi:ABC transporter ATP-binding protein [Streptomyces durmitorensis]|uniref:ABC transporter ATP-binding protein n=1 Tax=Streptomyces durmitorensis TaxID=319947 RepID=A0ABY4PQW2_9ACTN|nr:ABC transporter ATP-binding protein [Streptomyces durmitorensis]UQT55383.1 ABC transporter ATP-binding protein [Streptomyces durmitorensis]